MNDDLWDGAAKPLGICVVISQRPIDAFAVIPDGSRESGKAYRLNRS